MARRIRRVKVCNRQETPLTSLTSPRKRKRVLERKLLWIIRCDMMLLTFRNWNHHVMFQILEKKSDLKLKKKKKKNGDGDNKSDKSEEDEAKTRNAKFKELKESRQQKQRGEDVYTLGAEAKRLWEKVNARLSRYRAS